MKEILIPCIFMIIPLFASGQLSGDGSSGNPFYGTISTNTQWGAGDPNFGSTVYIGTSSNPDIIITTGGHLTISPGITVILTQPASDLIITGSGQLNADGTGSNPILFTKDPAGNNWGHISFETPGTQTPITGTGSFRHCTIEYGYTSGNLPGTNAAGGAIQVNAQGVIIENCFFNNNHARFGGAIAVNDGRNTIIRNSFFKSNYADEYAGALLLYSSTAATVENCIFENNHCEGSTSGGGAIRSDQNSSKIINCTFVNNASPQTGDALYTYSSPGTIVVNSIFWGSNDQYANNASTYSITNCAFEGIKPASSFNSIILNPVNTAVDGPNFLTTNGSDWSVKFISPCRDAGVNFYLGVTIPTSDYKGYPTIHNRDMGAYEVRYSRWTGANGNSWSLASNWEQNVDPSQGLSDVIIPSGLTIYPVNSSNPGFTIGAGKQMIMEPGSKVTLSSITNNGSLRLNCDATGMSSLITNSYSGNDADLELFLTGGPVYDGYRWHLISSPFSMPLPIDPLITVTQDLAQWIESWDRMSLDEGWIAFDGYIYPDGVLGGPTFDNFDPAKGYTYYYKSDRTYTLSGKINTSDKNISITCSNTGDLISLYGHNLIGNPFSSGLNWDAIIADPSYPVSTSKALHYRKDGTHVYYVNGVGSEPGVNGIIPPMQGFFVKTYAPSSVIKLAAGARIHDNIPSRYKGGDPVIPLVRLKISKGVYYDYTTVRFDDNAKSGLDMDFDAVKDFLSSVRPGIYTCYEGSKFVINGLPFPEHSIDIPIEVKLISSGNHTISATDLNGLENYTVSLIDNETGSIMNLRTTPAIPFSSVSGLLTNRFVLRVAEITTDTDYPKRTNGKEFNIYNSNGLINIQTNSDEWNNGTASIRVLDLYGRMVSNLENAELIKSSIIGLPAPHVGGLYLVEIRIGTKRFAGKVIVR